MEKLVDEFNRVVVLIGDIIDGLEVVPGAHADPLIEVSWLTCVTCAAPAEPNSSSIPRGSMRQPSASHHIT